MVNRERKARSHKQAINKFAPRNARFWNTFTTSRAGNSKEETIEGHQHMKSMVYSVVAIFTMVCSTMAQRAPDSVPQDSNPLSLQLRAQREPDNTVLLTWRGDPTSPGFTVYRSIGPGHYMAIATVGPNVTEFTYCCIGGGVTYFRVCDLLDPQTCSNEVRLRLPS
jgi:hypothetical protein